MVGMNDAKARVLVVDDDEEQRSALARMVARLGYEVETAGDGQEALDKLAGFAAHVLVTDMVMPRVDGPHLLQQLRERGGGPPAIVMTSSMWGAIAWNRPRSNVRSGAAIAACSA